MKSNEQDHRLPRRRVLQWFAAVAAAEGVSLPRALAEKVKSPEVGYGTDPVMAKSYERGEVWPLTLTGEERKTVEALGDVVFPKDELGPAASEVRVADFIDEWISAPYPRQQRDRKVIVPGLKALNGVCRTKFQKGFAELTAEQMRVICDEMAQGNQFFHVFTDLASGAYYSDPQCWEALGYVGNTPYGGPFTGPPVEVLDQADLRQTVD